MNVIAAIVATAVLCIGSYFWGGHVKAKDLDAIKTAMHQETKRALDDVKLEVTRVEREYNGKIELIQKQWDAEIAPLLTKAKAKCKEGAPSAPCQQANNAVLTVVFNLKKHNN